MPPSTLPCACPAPTTGRVTFSAARQIIADSSKIIDDQDTFANSIVGVVAGAAKTFCKFSPLESMCTKVTATVSKWTQRIIDDAGRIAKDQVRCAGAVTKYAEGIAYSYLLRLA